MSAKHVLIHRDRDVMMFRVIVKERGKGNKFQWNSKPRYIVSTKHSLHSSFSDYKKAMNFFLAEVLKQ